MKKCSEYKKNIETGYFGPTNPVNDNGEEFPKLYYKCKSDHRKSARKSPHKTRWILTEAQEYEVFRYADEVLNIGHSGDMFGFYSETYNHLEPLGENEERIAKFLQPSNSNDPWHGYPTDEYEFKDNVLVKWVQCNIISETTRKRLLLGKL